MTAPPQSNSPVAVDISLAQNMAPGTYTTTLRFATGSASATNVVYVDVPISLTLQQSQDIYAQPFGVATGSSVAVTLNNGAALPLTAGTFMKVGSIAAGTPYTITVPAQPTGQNCTFPDGNSTNTGPNGNTNLLQLRVTCNASLIGWTYVGGSKTLGDTPVYGTRGTPAAANTPGGRTPGAYARDAAGNLWLFGGFDEVGRRNDLWRYDVSTGQWTWISGSTSRDVAGTYGTLNTPSGSNVPGARSRSVAWFDASGNFWLFGGLAFVSPGVDDMLNDLWMYNVGTDTWTWVGGTNIGGLAGLGTYGTSPSTSNIPGYRHSATVVKQGTDTVWFFGGYGAGAINSSGRMNDLWKFTPSTREWEWMSGANQPIQTRMQGTLGVPNAANYPNARDGDSMWTDTSGNVWMFGGNNPVLGFENDLWRFNPTTREWTWMGGADRTNPSVVGSRGTYNPPGSVGNYPTSRANASAWVDASGDFWLFGGYGQSQDIQVTGYVNDLWKYSPATNTWSWLSGSSAVSSPAIYGTTGVATNTNVPSGRQSSAAWTDGSGRLLLWGGPTSNSGPAGYASDVWRVTPQ